jgi:hypothetical protein
MYGGVQEEQDCTSEKRKGNYHYTGRSLHTYGCEYDIVMESRPTQTVATCYGINEYNHPARAMMRADEEEYISWNDSPD